MSGTIAYLTLQATREGQAARAHVHEIIAGLRDLGWSVDLYEPSYSEADPGVFTRLAEFRRIQRQLAARVADYDLLYIRAHPFARMAARAAARVKVPVVHESNGPYEDLFTAWPAARPLRSVIERWQREQYRRASALIAVSENLAEWLRTQAPGVDVTVIPNGANTDLFSPEARPREGLPERYVTFFGALARWQGVQTMLEAARSTRWPEDVGLVIAGDGVERASVERAAHNNPRVVYLGTIPYGEVPGLVTGSIAGLSAKSAIGGLVQYASPLKPFEILACGRPVIVTDFPGQAEFVQAHDCGLVVPPDDAEALTHAVRELAADPGSAAQMGARGREAVVAEASWRARATATARVIGTAASGGGR